MSVGLGQVPVMSDNAAKLGMVAQLKFAQHGATRLPALLVMVRETVRHPSEKVWNALCVLCFSVLYAG